MARDMREWMLTVERQLREAKRSGIPIAIKYAEDALEEAKEALDQYKNLTPAAPIELTYQTALYTDREGVVRGRFTLDFPDVVFSTTGEPITVTRYELQGRAEGYGNVFSAYPNHLTPGQSYPGTPGNVIFEQSRLRPMQTVATSSTSSFTVDGLIQGQTLRYRARAVGGTFARDGLWSQEIVVYLEADTTEPPQPTPPRVRVSRGVIMVDCDGQAVNGPMPADLEYIALAHGVTSSPTGEVYRFSRAGGTYVLPGANYYDVQFFRLQAIDQTGNRGPWSEQVTGMATPLVDEDVILSRIDAAETIIDNAGALVLESGETLLGKLNEAEAEREESQARLNEAQEKLNFFFPSQINELGGQVSTAEAIAQAAQSAAETASSDAATAVSKAAQAATDAEAAEAAALASSQAADASATDAAAALQQAQAAGGDADAAQAAATAAQTAADASAASAAAAGTDAAAADAAAAQAAADAAQALADAAAAASSAADAETRATNAATSAATAQEQADAAAASASEALRLADDKIKNGSFELGFTHWEGTVDGSAGQIVSDKARTGTNSYMVQGSGELIQPGFPVEVGDTWRFEWHYQTESTYVSGSPGGLRLQKSTDGGLTYSDAANSTLAPNMTSWTYQATEYVIPEGVTHLRARIAYAYSGGAKAWMDDVRLIDVTHIKSLEAIAEEADQRADAAAASANTAQQEATAAQAAATTAQNQATAAAADALTAANAAEAAETSAASSASSATAAETRADDAATAAQNSLAQAQAAGSDAEAAQAAATAAQGHANTAAAEADAAGTAAAQADAAAAQAAADAAQAVADAATAASEAANAAASAAAAEADASAAQTDADTAAEAARKAVESGRTYINPAVSLNGIVPKQGGTPVVMDSPTAMAGKAIGKSGAGHRWFEDHGAMQAIDPTALYRFSIRVRITAASTVTAGGGLYYGAVGLADDTGTVYVNNTGADSYSSQQWAIGNQKPVTTGAWQEFVGYYKGISASTPTGAGTLASPRTFHANTKHFVPGFILDYNNGNGTWEVSNWSVDAIDPIGHQALLDAATAQAKANSAHTLAGTADSNATSALTMAGGKSRVYYDTTPPSGTANIDDTWRQVDGSGNVIAEWRWMTPGWTPQQVTSQMISNLDVGKLTVGTGVISQLVAQHIAAQSGEFIELDVSQLRSAAATIDQAVIDRLFADVVKAGMVTAEEFIGTNAILTGAITTPKLTVTEDMTVALLAVHKVQAGEIEVNTLFADSTFSGSLNTHIGTFLTNEDGTGQTSTVTGEGLKVTWTNPDTGEVLDRVKLGTFTDDYFSLNDDTGAVSTSINKDGAITARSLDVRDRISLGGIDLNERLNQMPQRLIAWAQVPVNDNMSSNGEVGLFELGWESVQEGEPARMYYFQMNNLLINQTAAGITGLRLRYTTDGSAPTINSSVIGYSYSYNSAGFSSHSFNRIIGSNNGPYMRVLVSLYDTTSGIAEVYKGEGSAGGYIYATITDLGETTTPTGSATTGGGTPWTGSTVAAPTNPTVTYTKEWAATGVRSYTGSGGTYNYNTSRGYQGLSPAGYGNLSSIYTFPSLTSTLSGAAINDIWVYVYFEHWWYNAGGKAQIRLHTSSSLPSTSASLSTNGVNSDGWPKGAGRWVRLPSSLYNDFKTGYWKGFGLVGDGTYGTYGISHSGKIKIRYTK